MNQLKEIILIGGGLSCCEIIDLITNINLYNDDKINIAGILDDNIDLKGKKINGVKVIGQINNLNKFKNHYFFVNIFSFQNRFKRLKIIKKINQQKKKKLLV